MQSAHAELLKAPYKTPSVRAHHHSLLEPQNPLTAPKWLVLLFLCSNQLLINDHIQPLYGTWQAYEFFFLKGLIRENTRCVRSCGREFRLCMNLNGFQLDGKFSFGCQRKLKKVKLELVVGKWEVAKTLWHTAWLIQLMKSGVVFSADTVLGFLEIWCLALGNNKVYIMVFLMPLKLYL